MPPRTQAYEKIARGDISIPVISDEERGYASHTVRNEGSFKAIVLLVDFSDKPASVNKSFFEDLFLADNLDFQQKYPVSSNVKSIQEYYSFVSEGKYEITFDIYGWFRLPQTYAYYVGSNTGLGSYPTNAQRMTEDAIELADGTVDFSKYDNDDDGTVDFLLVVHAGSGAEFEGDESQIWSHQWSVFAQKIKDGKRLSRYCTQPEYWVQSYDMTIGVYVHELGHLLFNLPDLYDIYSTSKGIGYWGLMGAGSWNDSYSVFGENEVSGYGGAPAEPTAWSKQLIGWLSPTKILENSGSYTISRNEILKYENQENANEYFLIEYRDDNVFNTHMPGYNGVMIYHVDDGFWYNVFPWVPGDDDSLHYHVAIEQKDGLWELEQNINRGTDDDLFYQGDAFTSITSPSSDFYGGQKGISVSQINRNGDQAIISLDESSFQFFIVEIPGTEYFDVFIKKDKDTYPSVIVTSSDEKPTIIRIREQFFRFRIYREEVDFTTVDGVSLKSLLR
jgi:immune inhibitor A